MAKNCNAKAKIKIQLDTIEIIKPLIAEEILESLQNKIEEERQVIVHCCYPAQPTFGNLIRIWKSTFLLDNQSGHQSRLLHTENITLFPDWTLVTPYQDFWFTLIFSRLPKGCNSFDLKEIIPEEDGFFVQGIKRNSTDVYRVKIN